MMPHTRKEDKLLEPMLDMMADELILWTLVNVCKKHFLVPRQLKILN